MLRLLVGTKPVASVIAPRRHSSCYDSNIKLASLPVTWVPSKRRSVSREHRDGGL
jgi:hypothetical protein